MGTYDAKGPATTLEEQTKGTEVQPPSPRDTVAFWARELSAAEDRLKPWHKQADEAIKRYLDDRGTDKAFRLNLFHSNVKTLESLLYANLPKVQVARRHLDSNDDAARIAAVMVERLLNNDLQENGRERDAVLRACLQDRLLPGLGCARVRYTFETEQVEVSPATIDPMTGLPIEAVYADQIKDEQAPIDYYYWRDVKWGWARNWADIPWLSYDSFLSKTEIAERFPGFEDKVQYSSQTAGEEKEDETKDSPHHQAKITEIWDRSGKCVYWYNADCAEMLDHKDDPLQLTGFLPSPPCLIANATTMIYAPVPDYVLSQDLYIEIDMLEAHLSILTDAISVRGVYNAGAGEISRMVKEGCENDLIPVEDWSRFSELGGLKGQVDWMPIDAIVNAVQVLTQIRNDKISLLAQTTGMSDVMQGSVNPYEGVGQTDTKVAFGSVRIQALQNQFAQFVSDLLQLQAEVICRHFEPQTIIERSNAMFLAPEEQPNIQAALELLRSPERARLRVEVEAESVALVDQHKVQGERTEFLNSVATFMQSMAPMMESKPESTPYMLQLLQFGLSGLRGAAEIEGVLDRAIEESKKAQQQPKEDPAAQAAQQAAQLKMQEIQAKAQADLQTMQADSQADIALVQANHQARMEELQLSHQNKMQEIQASTEAKLVLERIQMDANIAQATQGAATEVEKDQITSSFEDQLAENQARRDARNARPTND